MVSEKVKLRIDGVDWGGWKSFEASFQIDALCVEFALGLFDRWTPGMEAMPLAAGMPCEVLLDDQLFIKGHIDKVDFSVGAGNHAIAVNGRDLKADFVDCSAIHKPGQWKNMGLLDIANVLASPFGLKVRALDGMDLGPPIPVFKLEEGETAFEAFERLLKQKEFLTLSEFGDNSDVIALLPIGSIKSDTRLVQGDNVKDASASYDMTERFSDYIVKGQKQGNDQDYGLAAACVRGEAQDEMVPRYRPMLVRAENQVNAEDAIKRAKWEASTRAARSVTVSVTVPGWRRDNNNLWLYNSLVEVDIPYLKIAQELLITKVTYSLTNDGGTVTRMELKDPLAFTPEPPTKKDKTGTASASTPVNLQQASAESAWTAHKEAKGG